MLVGLACVALTTLLLVKTSPEEVTTVNAMVLGDIPSLNVPIGRFIVRLALDTKFFGRCALI